MSAGPPSTLRGEPHEEKARRPSKPGVEAAEGKESAEGSGGKGVFPADATSKPPSRAVSKVGARPSDQPREAAVIRIPANQSRARGRVALARPE